LEHLQKENGYEKAIWGTMDQRRIAGLANQGFDLDQWGPRDDGIPDMVHITIRPPRENMIGKFTYELKDSGTISFLNSFGPLSEFRSGSGGNEPVTARSTVSTPSAKTSSA